MESYPTDGYCKPIIIHAHIPKNAGTTVHEIFYGNFGSDHLLHWQANPLFCLSRKDIEMLVDQRPTLKSISSHGLRRMWPAIRGRPALPITFLRNPTSQFLSLLRYTRQSFGRLPAEVRRWWPDDTPHLGLRELADRYLRTSAALTGTTQLSQQTRFFCPLNYTNPVVRYDSTIYGHNNLSVASRILENFFFVGLVERMEESLELLKTKLKKAGIDLVVPANICANQTDRSESLDWLNENDPVGKRVLMANRNDELLYHRFAERFRLELARFAEGMQAPGPMMARDGSGGLPFPHEPSGQSPLQADSSMPDAGGV
jgi:hypothetical protein